MDALAVNPSGHLLLNSYGVELGMNVHILGLVFNKPVLKSAEKSSDASNLIRLQGKHFGVSANEGQGVVVWVDSATLAESVLSASLWNENTIEFQAPGPLPGKVYVVVAGIRSEAVMVR